MMASNSGEDALICYIRKNYYLSVLNFYGMVIKREHRKPIKMRYRNYNSCVNDVVYCKGSFYLHNYHKFSSCIMRKVINGSDPEVWWKKKKIEYPDKANKSIKVTLEESALVVNVNGYEMVIIEVNRENTPGREIEIKTGSEHKISCHEPLLNGKVLTVDAGGQLTIYELDLKFKQFTRNETARIRLKDERTEDRFNVTVCERSEVCAILVSSTQNNYQASRILVYQLSDRDRADNFRMVTQLELWFRGIENYLTICFSVYVKSNLILFGHSTKKTTAYIFDFDLKEGLLIERPPQELGGNRKCCKLMRVEGDVLGILRGGRIMSFRLLR